MSRVALSGLLCFVALATTGCAGCGDESEGARALTFVPTAGGESQAVYLQARSLEAGLLRVDVIGRGLTDVYGLAFRLEYDPAALSALSMSPTAFWPADGVSAAEQPVPGLLVAGLSARGDAAGAPAQDQALGTIDFAVSQPTSVEFVKGHGAVVGGDGAEVADVAWLGGDVLWQ